MEEGWIEAVLGAQYDWMAFRDLAARAAASVGQKMEDEKCAKEPYRAPDHPVHLGGGHYRRFG